MDSQFQDRNLLVAVIALQMEYISQSQLVDAMKDWIFDKSEHMESILERKAFISSSHSEFLKGIVHQHLNVHQNDIPKSLAALSAFSSTQKQLDGIDEELDATIQAVSQNRSKQLEEAADSISFDAIEQDLSLSKRFKILRPHAKGGLGEVSVATDTELNRQVAIKQIQEPFEVRPESRQRFLAEAEITGKLEHPGIVPVYSLGCDDTGRPFYAMRFIQGDSLKAAVRSLHDESSDTNEKTYRFRLRQLVGRLIDVCNAIHYAHSRGILHRDLKPGNIMLGRYGETLVVDWGLAKPIGKSKLDPDQIDPLAEETLVPRSGEGSTKTRMGAVVGTLAFMSPEQADGRIDSLGPWSDVYGLGATLYSIITGSQPIAKAEQTAMLLDIQKGKVVPIESHACQRDQPLEAVCMKAMKLNPADRYKSAGEMAEDLEHWLADEPVDAFPEPLQQRMLRWIRKHKTFCTTAVSVIVLIAIGSSVALSIFASKNRQLQSKQLELVESQDALQSFSTNMLESVEHIARDENTSLATRTLLMNRLYTELKPARYRAERTEFQVAFSDAARSEARMSITTGAVKEGLQQYDEAIDTLIQLSDSTDQLIAEQASRKLIETYGEKTGACRRDNRFKEAAALTQKAITLLPQLLSNKNIPELDKQTLLGRTILSQAKVSEENQDWTAMQQQSLEARRHLNDARMLQLKQGKHSNVNAEIYGILAAEKAIIAYTEKKQFSEARTLSRKEIADLRSTIETNGFDLNRRYLIGLLLNAQTRIDLADQSVDKNSIDRQVEAVAEMNTRYLVSKSGGLARELCRLKHTLALCYLDQQESEMAETVITEAIELLTPHAIPESAPAEFVLTLAECYTTRAELSGKQNLKTALELAQRAAVLAHGLPFYASLADELKISP